MSNVVLEVKNLEKNFGELQVLKDVSLDVHEGEVISVIGSSGSGKTTLLRCITCRIASYLVFMSSDAFICSFVILSLVCF